MHWIDSPDTLARVLEGADGDAVALDTEFVREKTYFPQLALVQLERAGEIILIDPLSVGAADPLRSLLGSTALKLMHSPSEDLQTFRHAYGVLPRPLFDTQTAAALCGIGAGLGYQALVATLLDVKLEKGETRSDWLRRPLSEAQLHYAAEDVRHLRAAYLLLDARLAELGRRSWLDEDCARALALAERDEPDPNPHLALRPAQRMRPEQQARLRVLLLWREQQARRSDRPRSWILDNELVIELALRTPTHRAEFEAWLDARPKSPRRARDELWHEASRPLTAAERDIPLASQPDPRWREPLRRMQDEVAEVARELGIPEGLLCAKRHLESLIERQGWPEALRGWRQHLLEQRLLPLLP